MCRRNNFSILLVFFLIQLFWFNFAWAKDSFSGEINRDQINIRTDATTASEIICTLNKGDVVEVIKESYAWYKIRLPKQAPSFVKKNLVSSIDERSAKVIKERVNVRLHPTEAGAIIGRVDKDEIINILEDKGEWFKIAPVKNSFGWVHQKFVNMIIAPAKKEIVAEVVLPPTQNEVVVIGTVQPFGKVFKRNATHKLITETKVYLLKGDKTNLNASNYQKVKIKGILIPDKKQRYPLIEVSAVKILN